MTSDWVMNSLFFPYDYNLLKLIITWASFCYSLIIFCHSFLIHGKRRHKVRNFTEVAAIFSMAGCIFLHVAGTYPSKTNFIVFSGLLTYGILGCFIQVIDNYFVLILCQFIAIIPKVKYVMINFYIWFTLLAYLPFVTIIPLFADTNSPEVYYLYIIFGGYLWSVMYLCFNIYLGWKIWNVINNRSQVAVVLRDESNRVVRLTYRNIYHLLIVSICLVIYELELFYPEIAPVGMIGTLLGPLTSYHFLFNYNGFRAFEIRNIPAIISGQITRSTKAAMDVEPVINNDKNNSVQYDLNQKYDSNFIRIQSFSTRRLSGGMATIFPANNTQTIAIT